MKQKPTLQTYRRLYYSHAKITEMFGVHSVRLEVENTQGAKAALRALNFAVLEYLAKYGGKDPHVTKPKR